MASPERDESYNPPQDHISITVDNMHLFSMKEGALYWKGQKLKIEEQLHLTLFQKIIATLVAIASICSPIILFLANKEVIINGEPPVDLNRIISSEKPFEISVVSLPATNKVVLAESNSNQDAFSSELAGAINTFKCKPQGQENADDSEIIMTCTK